MKNSAIKQELLSACYQYVEKRIGGIQTAIDDLEAALKLETKCSMGDKYETGRAMLHLEFEKLAAQLEQYKKLKKTLRQIQPEKEFNIIGFGSIVKTTEANYFLSIPAGEILAENEKYYAIGASAPIAQALSGKKEGEEISFNGRKPKILHVY